MAIDYVQKADHDIHRLGVPVRPERNATIPTGTPLSRQNKEERHTTGMLRKTEGTGSRFSC